MFSGCFVITLIGSLTDNGFVFFIIPLQIQVMSVNTHKPLLC